MNEGPKPPVVMLGNSGVVARQLLPQLARAGYAGHVVSRSRPDLPDGFEWVETPAVQDGRFTVPERAVVFGLWPIWLVADVVDHLEGAAHIVALSSTSMLSKTASSDPGEQALSGRLAEAEALIADKATKAGMTYTILRPTIIYDAETDRSINEIAGVVRRFGFFAVAGSGRGMRQPIHAGDVAAFMVSAADNARAANRALNITGGDTISYREMVARVAQGLGRPAIIVPVPTLILRLLVKTLRGLGLTRHSPNFIDRMNQDLAFDGSEAVHLLNVSPRAFSPEFGGSGSER